MRKDFGAKTWLYPMPVLIIGTYDDDGTPNAMNAAWGGICNVNHIAICIDKSHKTAKNLPLRKALTVSFGDVVHMVQCDFVGLVSGNDEPDKLKKAGFTAIKSSHVDAPVFAELPLTLECRLVSYDTTTECAIGEIVNVSADESVLDEKGNVSLEKFIPITYDPVTHDYRAIGNKVGKAFSAGNSLK